MRATVVSQVPPPFHGSTIVTSIFLDVCEEIDLEVDLVDRRFSRSVGEIGSFSTRKLASVVSIFGRLSWSLISRRPDVVVIFVTNRTFSFLVDFCLVNLARLFRRRVILYPHTDGFRTLASRGGLWRRLVSNTLSAGSIVVCLGPTLSKDVLPWVPPEKIRVVENPSTLAPISERECGQTGTVLFFSNLIPEKGADTFLQLAARLAALRPDLTFKVAGGSDDTRYVERLREEAESPPLAGRVTFLGAVRGEEEKRSLFSSADLLVFPTRYEYEAQPLTIIEAFSQGLPVVAFDQGGIGDIVHHNVNGFVAQPGSLEELVGLTLNVLDCAPTQARLSEGALRSAVGTHSIDAYASRWRTVLRDTD